MDKAAAAVNIHNGILLSHKKNEVMPLAATWMDLETFIFYFQMEFVSIRKIGFVFVFPDGFSQSVFLNGRQQ